MQVIKLPINKVMLIDDDEDDSMVFKLALEEVDPAVRFEYLNSCENAIDTISGFQPDLLFLDINLPRITGIECLQKIRKHSGSNGIPVVMYSSSELPRDLKDSYESGATLYFLKPSSLPSLVVSLRSIFQMGWHAPGEIKTRYFQDGHYLAY